MVLKASFNRYSWCVRSQKRFAGSIRGKELQVWQTSEMEGNCQENSTLEAVRRFKLIARTSLMAFWFIACCSLMSPRSIAGLIFNGDFQVGNTGFTTDYNFSPGNIYNAKSYDIVSNPAQAHFLAASYSDHTFGDSSGRMLVINEGLSPNLLVWKQTVSSIATNSNYVFEGYISSWYAFEPAQIRVLFNGNEIGTTNAPSVTAVWYKFSFFWNSGAASLVDIEIRSMNGSNGGDFALDDFSLSGLGTSSVPEPSSFAIFLTSAGILFRWRKYRRNFLSL